MRYLIAFILTLAANISYAANQQTTALERDRSAGRSLYSATTALDSQSASALDSLRARSQCASVLSLGTKLEPLEGRPASSISPAQVQANERLRALCTGFSPADFSREKIKQIEGNAAQSGDAQYAAFKRFISAFSNQTSFSRETRSNLLREVFTLQDATLLSELGLRIFIYPSDGKGNFIWFSGTQYLLKDDPEIVYASRMVQCDFGATCNENDFEVLTLCANTGVCYSDRAAMVSDQAKSAGKDWELIKKLRADISTAIKATRVADFIKP